MQKPKPDEFLPGMVFQMSTQLILSLYLGLHSSVISIRDPLSDGSKK